MNLSGYHNSTSETPPGEEASSSEHDAALLQPQGLRTPGRISKKPRYNVESDPFNPFSSRNNNQSLGLEQGHDQSQDRDSQEPQHAEGEERESAMQSELEATRRLVKTMDAMDLSMTETREKLKTFYKTADETNALLDMWIRVLSQAEHTQKLLLDPAWEGYNIEESRHRENQERRAAYQQAMESDNSRRRSYGLHANHSTLTQSSSSVPSSSTTTTTTAQLSTGSMGAPSGTSPLSLHSSQSSGRQTMMFAKQQPLKKSPSELVAAAHAHASAIAANRKRNPLH
ncbi:MAG: DASH complex subunit Duo1-domain-containing protein [Benniella sp.]|nr:MAG: DASH complex subunit Duo1-domain-containing protein [Benniella sp.]